MRYYQISKNDYTTLLVLIDTIIQGGGCIDSEVLVFMKKTRDSIQVRVNNENEDAASSVLEQIDVLQNMLGDIDGSTDGKGDPRGH